jgi:cytochrome d ubiquinol oxidase subunit I
MISLVLSCAVYSFIFAFGVFYIYRLLRAGPAWRLALPAAASIRDLAGSVVNELDVDLDVPRHVVAGE